MIEIQILKEKQTFLNKSVILALEKFILGKICKFGFKI